MLCPFLVKLGWKPVRIILYNGGCVEVDHLELSAFWQVPVGSHDVQLNSQGLPSVQNLSYQPLSMNELKKCDKTALLWLLQTQQVFLRLLSDYWRLPPILYIVIHCCTFQQRSSVKWNGNCGGAVNTLLRFCYPRSYGDCGRWLAWPALQTLPKFCLIPGKGGSSNFWEDKCAWRSEWQSSVWHLDPWMICLFFYNLRFHPHLANVLGKTGDRGGTVIKVLCYKLEGRWFDPRWCNGIFHWHKSFRSHYGPRVDSASNRNEYQENFLVVNAAGA
jgi:hypothetical protein